MTTRRRALWRAGAPARALLVGLIRVYRMSLTGLVGGQCRFYPSCSHYAEEAIGVHGAARGVLLAGWRVARCGPFTAGGVDHVPPARHREGGGRMQPVLYDAVTPRTSPRNTSLRNSAR